MSQAAMDAGAFSEMKEMMGETFLDIIELCASSFPEQLEMIQQAIDNNDAEQLFNVAHKMKSSSGSIGAFGLAEKAEALEMVGRQGNTDVPSQAVNELRDATEQVVNILNTELGR